MAPELDSLSKSSELCRAARVMTMRLPESGDAEASAKLAPDGLEDGLRARFPQKAGDAFTEGGGLVGSC